MRVARVLVVRLFLTAILIIAAVAGVDYVWTTYFAAPWTRDARVRANVVEVASYVPGKIVRLDVRTNQLVHAGDLLAVVDPATYRLALAQREAQLRGLDAQRQQRRQDASRLDRLAQEGSPAANEQATTNAGLAAQAAEAAYEGAVVLRDQAQLDLDRTEIRAPVDGYVTNLSLEVGDYAEPGSPLLAVVDRHSYRVDAYFMETKLPRIRIGAPATIQLMSGGPPLRGRVDGIERAILDTQNAAPASTLLQAPQAAFEWIRLAQRVPVRIEILDQPDGFPLVAGVTATVIVHPGTVPPPGQPTENQPAPPTAGTRPTQGSRCWRPRRWRRRRSSKCHS